MLDNITFPRAIDLAKLRWRIKRDHQDINSGNVSNPSVSTVWLRQWVTSACQIVARVHLDLATKAPSERIQELYPGPSGEDVGALSTNLVMSDHLSCARYVR